MHLQQLHNKPFRPADVWKPDLFEPSFFIKRYNYLHPSKLSNMNYILYNRLICAGVLFIKNNSLIIVMFFTLLLLSLNSEVYGRIAGSDWSMSTDQVYISGHEKTIEQRVTETLKKNGQTLHFMENLGQVANPEVLYYFEGKNGAVYIEKKRSGLWQ
jgi:hypothetical protein